MVYDPIKKKEYDRKRNAKQKAEYLAKNPNYKPSRTSKYDEETPTQQGSGFSNLLSDYYINQPKPTPPPPPKPKYNPASIEAKKSKEHYADDDEDADLKMIRMTNTPQAYQQIKNSLAGVKFY